MAYLNGKQFPFVFCNTGGGNASEHSYSINNQAIEEFVDEVSYTSDYSSTGVSDYTSLPYANLGKPQGASVSLKAGTLKHFNGFSKNAEAVSDGVKTIYNNEPNTTGSYAVINNGKVVSYGELNPTGGVRVIYGESLKNMRDLGGWTCDGGTVRYGLLYRSSEFTGDSRTTQLSTADKAMLQNLLGIRAELDMRDVSESGGNASFDEIVDYLNQPIGNYADALSADNKAKFKTAVEFVMNKAIQRLPVTYHCVAGADRTGTISWLLLGVLGVSQSDCDKEYEITNFSGPTRFRNTSLASLFAAVNALEGDDFTHKCMQALLNCGISINLINHFRHAMIDGNPVDLVEPSFEPFDYVVSDLFVAPRMAWSSYVTSGIPDLSNSNSEIALGVTTTNDFQVMDRSSNTFYTMPVPSEASKVTLTLYDEALTNYKIDYMGYKESGGSMTRVFRGRQVSDLVYSWTAGEIDYITITVTNSDGTSFDWGYDATKLSVKFTNY